MCLVFAIAALIRETVWLLLCIYMCPPGVLSIPDYWHSSHSSGECTTARFWQGCGKNELSRSVSVVAVDRFGRFVGGSRRPIHLDGSHRVIIVLSSPVTDETLLIHITRVMELQQQQQQQQVVVIIRQERHTCIGVCCRFGD